MQIPQLIDLPKILDDRGNLSFVEQMKHIPFEIKRTYWIYDVPGGEERGGHAFRQNEEFIVALSGAFDVVVDDGQQKKTFTLNRSYYAAFYAVKAILALDGVDFKRHKDAVAYFNQHYVKEERLPREIGRKLGELKRLREKSDYDDFYIVSVDQAREQLEAAREINKAIRQFLNEVQGGSGLSKFFGSLPDIGDGMEFQEKTREEWDDQ